MSETRKNAPCTVGQSGETNAGQTGATLYGVSVGPGDPELTTCKAKRILEKCDIWAVPSAPGHGSMALDIARQIVHAAEKRTLFLPFPMTRAAGQLEECHRLHADTIARELDTGKDVAFISIGDVSVYSTFAYVGNILRAEGYHVEMIPGATSFCAVACALGQSLTTMGEPLHVLPGATDALAEQLALAGTKVIMKSGGSFSRVRSVIEASGLCASAVSDCGLPAQMRYACLADMPEDASYFTTIIVRDRP